MERNTALSNILSMMMFVALMIAISSADVFAAGTSAGTAITNMATVNYSSGTNARTATSNTVTLHIAHKVSASFSPAYGTSSGVDDQTFYVPITFTQTGNRGDNFNIAIVKTKGVVLTKYTVDVLNDVLGNGVYDVGDNAITNTGYMAADAAKKVLLRVIVASETADNDSLNVAVTFTSQAANNTADTVVANVNAPFTYQYYFKVQKPVIAFSVSQTTVTTANASRIPGQAITYQVSLQNTGHAAPTSATTDIHWQNSVTNMPYTSTTGTAAADSGATPTKVFTVPSASLPAGMGSALTFNVTFTIDQSQNTGTGPIPGLTIYNVDPANSARVYVKYAQGAANNKFYNAAGGPFNIAVGTSSGATFTATPANQSGNPTDSLMYSFTIKNTGNHADTYDLLGTQNGGNYNVYHTFATTNNGSTITVLPSLAAGASTTVWVRVTIPAAATDGQLIRENIAATTKTASADAPTGGTLAASYIAPLITTITAPNVTVTLSDSLVSGSGTVANPAPGDVIMWRVKITNSGSGNATSISSSNLGYLHTTTNTFVASSIDVDLTGVLPLAGVWGIQGNNGAAFTGGSASVSGGLVTVQVTSLNAGTSAQYRYKVTVQ